MSKIVVVGASNIDVCAKALTDIDFNNSLVGKVEFNPGGVARNIAENLSLLNADVTFLTALGEDNLSLLVKDNANKRGIKIITPKNLNKNTGVYVNISDNDGKFILGINDMTINDSISKDFIYQNKDVIKEADAIVIDTNINKEVIECLTKFNKKIYADCTSSSKGVKLKNYLSNLYIIKSNPIELKAITNKEDINEGIKELVNLGAKRGIVTLQKDGALIFEVVGKQIVAYTASNMPNPNIKDVSGCGDSFLSGFIISDLKQNSISESIYFAQAAAYITSQSISSVNENMSVNLLEDITKEYKKNIKLKKEEIL